MPVHSGPVTAVMVVLLIAGTQKLLDPSPTSGALRAAGLPASGTLVRLLGLVEAGTAIFFLVVGGPVPAAMGSLLYAGFAWFVINALVRDLPISSCGCLGATETPPTMIHVVMNLGALGLLGAAVIIPVAPMGGVVGQELNVVIPYVLFTGATVYMLYAILAVLPLITRRARATGATLLPAPRRPET
jgi:hypothetical protein